MTTREADLAAAIESTMIPLSPLTPLAVAYAADTAKAMLAPETLTTPPLGVTGPILAAVFVQSSEPGAADSKPGNFWLNTGGGTMHYFDGSAWQEFSVE